MDNERAMSLFTSKCGIPVQYKKMFGGIGIFSDKIMFALIYDGEVFLKSDEKLASKFVENSVQFQPPFGRQAKMPYWKVSEKFMKDSIFPLYASRALKYAIKTKK